MRSVNHVASLGTAPASFDRLYDLLVCAAYQYYKMDSPILTDGQYDIIVRYALENYEEALDACPDFKYIRKSQLATGWIDPRLADPKVCSYLEDH